jgi:hypothetical protein
MTDMPTGMIICIILSFCLAFALAAWMFFNTVKDIMARRKIDRYHKEFKRDRSQA